MLLLWEKLNLATKIVIRSFVRLTGWSQTLNADVTSWELLKLVISRGVCWNGESKKVGGWGVGGGGNEEVCGKGLLSVKKERQFFLTVWHSWLNLRYLWLFCQMGKLSFAVPDFTHKDLEAEKLKSNAECWSMWGQGRGYGWGVVVAQWISYTR
jgi:hypothetical protein